MLFIEGDIITIDAMGTQTSIAEKIIDNGANYIISVKENQKNLLEEIQDEFLFGKNIKTFEHLDIGHGRIETRKCSVITDFIFIKNPDEKWKNLNQVIKIESIREFKNSDRKPENATQYYITSLDCNPEKLIHCVRSH